MSKLFKVINRVTGDVWKPTTSKPKQYLMLYDSGYAAVVTEDFYTTIQALDRRVWYIKFKEKHNA